MRPKSVSVTATLILLWSGCSSAEKSGRTLERIRQAGVVRVGYNNEVPFAYYDTAARRVTGETPEVTRHILGQMGVSRMEGVLTEFGALIPGLKAGRLDIIASGMYVTPMRCRQIAFSEPLSCVGQCFLVRSGNPLGFHSYEDAGKHISARLGVVAGGIELHYARSSGIPEDRITIFPDPPSALAGLKAGRIDAMGGPLQSLQTLLGQAKDSSIDLAQPFHEPVIGGKAAKLCEAVGFRIEDVELREEFNRRLRVFLGSKEHLDIIRPFGFRENDIPTGVTTEELCRPWSTP